MDGEVRLEQDRLPLDLRHVVKVVPRAPVGAGGKGAVFRDFTVSSGLGLGLGLGLNPAGLGLGLGLGLGPGLGLDPLLR